MKELHSLAICKLSRLGNCFAISLNICAVALFAARGMEIKMKNLIIRSEEEKDYRAVEELTREAFWNVYKPGADEHYYVHEMRKHPDFIPELAFVLEKDGKIIGNIMYTKAWLEDENGER